MSRLLALICACLALGLVAAGCGDDDSDDGGDGGGAAATTEQAPPETGAGGDDAATGGGAEAGDRATAAVDVVDIDYEPRALTVPAGTTVTWTNTGDLPHTVTKDGGPGPDFDSGTLDPGDTFEQTFETAGTIDYLCTIHAGQDGSVTVE